MGIQASSHQGLSVAIFTTASTTSPGISFGTGQDAFADSRLVTDGTNTTGGDSPMPQHLNELGRR